MKNRFLKIIVLFFLVLSFFNFTGCSKKKDESPKTSQTNEYYKEGDKYFKEQNWAQAIEVLKKSIGSNPNDTQSHLLLGQTYIQILKPDEASIEFQKCIQLNPKEASAYDGMGWVYLLKNREGKNGDTLEKALENFKKALSIKPGDSLAYNGLGWYGLYKKNLDYAKENFNTALKIDSTNFSAHTGLGYTNINQKNYSAAIENFKKAEEIGITDIAIFNGLGLAYMKSGKYPEAEKEFRKALGVDKNDMMAHAQLAAVLMVEGDYLKSLEEFKMVNQLSPQGEIKDLIQAMQCYIDKDYDKAINALRKMIAVYPGEAAEFYWLTGKCYEAQKNFSQARIEYQNSLRAFPGFIPAERSLRQI